MKDSYPMMKLNRQGGRFVSENFQAYSWANGVFKEKIGQLWAKCTTSITYIKGLHVP